MTAILSCLLYACFLLQNFPELFCHRQIIEDDAEGFGIVGPVDEGRVGLTAPLARLEILCAGPAQKRSVPVFIGAQSGALDPVVGDTLVTKSLLKWC